jgi:predicted NAD/FAD-binding protein
MPEVRPRAAVIGAGVAGLTAAYILQRVYDVTLYEAEDRLGGHADTHEIAAPDGRPLSLDTGFIVHNTLTYPRLVRLLRELSIETRPTDMSMSVRCQGCGLEYAGSRGLSGLVPAPGTLARPRYAPMIARIPLFYRAARRLLATSAADSLTLGEFLRAGRYPRYFTGHFVIPLIAAVWSCSPAEALGYPAAYLFEFLDRHGMLSLRRAPGWRTITGGSREYVEQIAKRLTRIHAGQAVTSVRRDLDGVEVADVCGTRRRFARAVIATHPDQALRMLDPPTPAEREALGAFSYRTSAAALHTDASVLPRAGRARASWNYLLGDCGAAADQVHVSYHLNRLEGIGGGSDYIVTLNPLGQVAPQAILDRMWYAHPLYTPRSVAAQRRLPELNSPVLAFAGAYHGWGFHEDGCRSGAQAARALGVRW